MLQGNGITRSAMRQDYDQAKAKRARVARFWLEITDQDGILFRYTVQPLVCTAGTKGFQLSKYRADGSRECVYHVTTAADGLTRCNCPAGQAHVPCKHTASLEALGVLDRDRIRSLRARELLCDQRESEVAEREARQRVPVRSPHWPGGATL